MKPKIALVTGGFSGEAVVSYRSADTIQQHIDPDQYEVYRIDIRKEGWFYEATDGSKYPVNKSDFSVSLNDYNLHFDAVFIALHGTPGEDGKLQGYFDLIGLPYTSCNAATSAITFNKRYTVGVAAFSGIAVAKSVHLFRDSAWSAETAAAELKFPVFVKPNNGGSSIGMSKVLNPEALEAAIHKAFKEDDQVLVEEMVEGCEFTIGVFRSEGKIITLPMTEIRVKEGVEFFNFEAKYEGKSEEITPAVASPKHFANIEAAAKKIYQVFNCSGIVRIDFIYHEATDTPYMLEINTVPGQSAASIVPQQVKAYGWTLRRFYGTLLKEILP
ncbi:MAG: D-alanine--D-alanine ligase [Bacteroidetes bacterium]|nr:D-alanine--D-alanine ligase [Bacteroidota bacterium]